MFIVKFYLEHYVVSSQLKPYQNIAKKWFVWNNSVLEVFEISFCFIEEWILNKKCYLWFLFGLFVFQGIQLFVKYFSWYTWYMYMRLGHVSSSKSHPIPNALFLLYEYFKNKFGRAEGSVGLITYKVNKYRLLSNEFYRGLMERMDGSRLVVQILAWTISKWINK